MLLMIKKEGCISFKKVAYNGKMLCDGGFYAVQSFKTAIAKPVLYEGVISRTTLSSKHVKRKIKNERGEFKNKINK